MVPGFLAGLVVGFAASALILYVGRNYLDEAHVTRMPSADDGAVQFQFYDELEQSSQEEARETVDSNGVQTAEAGTENTDQAAVANQEPQTNAAEERLEVSSASTPQSEPPTLAQQSEKIYLQVGYFSEFERAQKQRAVLLLAGFQVNTIETQPQDGSGTRYRVLVGPYSNTQESAEATANLKELELTPFVYK